MKEISVVLSWIVVVSIICPISDSVSRQCGQVHLTVSASVETNIELNWITGCDRGANLESVTIEFYKDMFNSTGHLDHPLLRINATDYPEGYLKTSVEFGFPELPGNWEYTENLTNAKAGSHCFPFWIASWNGSDLIDSRCLKIEPTWMNDYRDHIRNKNLVELLIPGTHDSGAFEGATGLVGEYTLTHDRSIWSQLVFGMRFLDLRIGYYENYGFTLNHGMIRLMKVEPILAQIRKFVELSPREIVILDFHGFPVPSDFNSSLHDQFIQIIERHFGDLAYRKSHGRLNVDNIWRLSKNFVISYASTQKVEGEKEVNFLLCTYCNFFSLQEYDLLWTPVRQFWADTTDVSKLKSYIDDTLKNNPYRDNALFAMMAELTPQVMDILSLKNTLRSLANDVNPSVTKWFRDQWANNTNIVAVDYFLGNDIVDVAIQTNTNKVL